MADIIKLKKEVFDVGNVNDFFSFIRGDEGESNEQREYFANEISKVLGVDRKDLWNSEKFHFLFRVGTLQQLNSVVQMNHLCRNNVKKCLESGRELSILPFNIVLGEPTVHKYLPSLPKLYSNDQPHTLDPYGIFRGKDQIKAEIDGKEIYLASRKGVSINMCKWIKY